MEWIAEILNETWKFIVLFLSDNIPLIVGSVKAVVIAVAIMSVVPILVWLERRLGMVRLTSGYCRVTGVLNIFRNVTAIPIKRFFNP